MPRKPANELENTEKIKKSVSAKQPVQKKTTKKEPTEKKATKKSTSTATTKAATTAKKASSAQKATSTVKKPTTEKKETTSTQKTASTTRKTTSKTATKKSTSKTTKSTTKKTTTNARKSTTRKTSTKAKKSVKGLDVNEITSTTDLTRKIEVLEYYDLPYRYNQTVVKVLAQTPTTLFIYWDISDVDRLNFVKQYGEDFFNNTKPVLVIHNNTMHYSFEIEIDDFANSCYLHVNDSNCEYTVELGRRAKYYNDEKHIEIPNNYLPVTSSNVIDSPNDCVLFDKDLKTVYFKDVKTNIVTAKDITSISFIRNMGRIYNLYDLQSDFTKNSWINSNHLQLDLKNPSSSSSTFK